MHVLYLGPRRRMPGRVLQGSVSQATLKHKSVTRIDHIFTSGQPSASQSSNRIRRTGEFSRQHTRDSPTRSQARTAAELQCIYKLLYSAYCA